MHLSSHFVISWLGGTWLDERRDRVLVTWAGVMPDLDSLSLFGGHLAYVNWHHVVTHGVVAAVGATALTAIFAKQKAKAAAAAFLVFHLHLLCDLIGSGFGWTITYFYPFSKIAIPELFSWPLNSWPNIAITAAALLLSGVIGIKHSRTFVEAILPKRVDEAVVKVLRNRFGGKQTTKEAG